ncbi:MAG: UDP-N-acetylmuramate--L-alanine ligase [Patescibacteria group bacterium]
MFKKYKKIHFAGAGGIGISALAKWAILNGVKVSGSDVSQSEITDELVRMGAKIFIGQDKNNVPEDAELLIYSDAVPKNNPERALDLPQKSYFEMLGEISRVKKTIAVSGTNGKSTTTAMLGKILIDAGYDPTVIVGSKIKDFKYGNFHPGEGEWFVVEACEHNAHMLNLAPEYIVLTNIESDHLDFYKNLENILRHFSEYVSRIPQSGFLIYNADDANTAKLSTIGSPTSDSRRITYGAGTADFRFEDRFIDNGKQSFKVFTEKNLEVEITLNVPGLFNVYNAMAAASCAFSLGVPFDKIAKSLAEFSGLWRRFERVGEYKGAPVISDYGHHPTAIAGTILAAREFYPEHRVVLAFEPHQHHRTKALFADFVRSFDDAEVVILSEIYKVEGRVEESHKDISSKKLAEAIVKYWESGEDDKRERQMIYCENLDETEQALRKAVKKKDVVVIMGAGDVDGVARRLCKKIK